MKRTVTALCETREEAERMAAALKAQGLGGGVEILDAEHDEARRHGHGLGGWLGDIFRGHDDHKLYAEGLRRGHVLVLAKVDELDETRAASIMDAAAMNLGAVADTRGSEARRPEAEGADGKVRHRTYRNPLDSSAGVTAGSAYASTFGGVRAYTL